MAFIATLLLALLIAPSALAFTLTPMNASFDPEGPGATQSFILENDNADKIPIQISMTKRVTDENGNETNPEADDEFTVYPPQLILGPKERRTIRVTWLGAKKPDHELAYRIVAEQLPVETEKPPSKKGVRINMLLKYVGAVYIIPKEAKPGVKLVQASASTSDPKRISILFENSGTAHLLLKGLHLTLETTKKVILKPEELKDISGQNILAGARRKFTIQWPSSLPKYDSASGPLKASFELKE